MTVHLKRLTRKACFFLLLRNTKESLVVLVSEIISEQGHLDIRYKNKSLRCCWFKVYWDVDR